jgi:hypothetical protein
MKRKRNLIIGLVITTATTLAVLTTVSAPNVETPITTKDVSVTETSEIPVTLTEPSPTDQGSCSYQWAYHNAPELSASFVAALKNVNPAASGSVEYYGEDCIYADGTSTFGAMETDFYVHLQVDDLNQEEEFGNWVAQVMKIVTEIPRKELSGNYGFVEFWFEKNETEHIVFRVPIPQYISEAQGKSGAELFNLYSHNHK